MKFTNLVRILCLLAPSLLLTGCLNSMPVMGGGSGNTVTGSAAGASSNNKNSQIASCKEPLGTLTVFEDTSLPWWGTYQRYYPKLGSTIPVVRTMIQQSNCFVMVERGRAMDAMRRERELMQAGDLRGNSNFGQGQMVSADYTLSPSVTFEQSTLGKITGAAYKILPGSLFGSGSVSAAGNEASATLLMIDNRSGVQVSSSVGSAKNYDFSIQGYSIGGGGWGGASGFAKTPEGKVIIAAFADSYNQMVKAIRNYKPQVIKGGLGTGGTLKVDGAKKTPRSAPASEKKSKSQNKVAAHSPGNVRVSSGRTTHVSIAEYDGAALETYYEALKDAVASLSKFANMGQGQINAINQYNDSGINLWALMWTSDFSGDFETSKIELESWPMDAKKEGWKILGKRIKKYNKLFRKHKKTILADKDVTEDIKNKLNGIELVTEKSLFEE
ncbi:MAG TPA: hypothetical protein ENJ08_00255 [Gammaproteobacteria bacterium]|nr:hypothetical protein [Gammaproteobacteria bacterium]